MKDYMKPGKKYVKFLANYKHKTKMREVKMMSKYNNTKAENEMMTKSMEIKQGHRERFSSGISKIAKRICFGYSQDENGELIVNPEEAKIVKWIFESYLSGFSLGKIADGLYEMGIKSPTGKDKWNREAIDKLLSNEKYVGAVLLQKTVTILGVQVENKGLESRYLTSNSHSAIISLELFQDVQRAKVERSRGRNMEINTANDMLSVMSML